MTVRMHSAAKGKWSEEKRVALLVGLAACALALAAAGCASLGEDYSARYGLTNPDNPLTRSTLADETFRAGTVGEKYMEDYDKKYHEEDAFSATAPSPPVVEESK